MFGGEKKSRLNGRISDDGMSERIAIRNRSFDFEHIFFTMMEEHCCSIVRMMSTGDIDLFQEREQVMQFFKRIPFQMMKVLYRFGWLLKLIRRRSLCLIKTDDSSILSDNQ